MSVSELGRRGLTATQFAASERLHEKLHAALDEAENSGVTFEIIIGMLECTKAAVLDSYFRAKDDSFSG